MLYTKINTIWLLRFLIGLLALSYFLQPTLLYAFSDTEVPLWIATNDLATAPTEEVVTETQKNSNNDESSSYQKTFIISAYYSAVPNQNKYVTGSYAGDIRLNGSGVNGADGTPVYPGMVAAPKTYAFGTKMEIPGIGTVAVHDRGGAIVTSGARGNAHDRLDVWMGYGDEGLMRALKWGKRTVGVNVYGINESIAEEVTFADITVSNAPGTAQRQIFSRQLTIGSNGEDVEKLQEILRDAGYFEGEIDGNFNNETRNAVIAMQLEKGVVSHSNAYGSGYVGPQTMRVLASLPVGAKVANAKSDEIESVEFFTSDLSIGDTGDEVRKLQEELKKVNLLGINPTGYYGEVTEHAVFKFQQIHKLAGNMESVGAGIFGPITRTKLNEIVRARLKTEQLVLEKRSGDA